jgi:hypothetical protein
MPGEGGMAESGDLGGFSADEAVQAISVTLMTLVSNSDRSRTTLLRLVWGEDAGRSTRDVGITGLLLPVLLSRSLLSAEKGNKGVWAVASRCT